MPHATPNQRLRPGQTLLVGSLVFGLFFGAGNLIFPVQLGRDAGSAVTTATVGFLVTAVGLPVLGVVASAISRSANVFDVARPVARWFAVAFSVALYLTIGPLFAIPRTATVSYEVGVRPLLPGGAQSAGLVVFSVAFFALTWLCALRPGRIIDLVGRYLTPIFLVLLAGVVVAAVVNPLGSGALPAPAGPYAERGPLVAGLLDGYNTMDALASLAFAIVIIDALRRLGITRPTRVAAEAAKAGVVGGVGMALVYGALAYVGSSTVGAISGADADNGGAVLSAVSRAYYGTGGQYLIAAIVFIACLKTAIGLIAACAEMFTGLFPAVFAGERAYRAWVSVFVLVSFAVANVGLKTIVAWSVPVLLFLYPLAIVLVLLALAHPWLGAHRGVYIGAVALAAFAAMFDLVGALPEPLASTGVVTGLVRFAGAVLPGYTYGFGWVVPALVGALGGYVVSSIRRPARPELV